MIEKNLPELVMLKRLIDEGGSHLEVAAPCSIAMDGREFPVYSIAISRCMRSLTAFMASEATP